MPISPAASLARLALAFATVPLLTGTGVAGQPPVERPHDPFVERGRFTIEDVDLRGGGNHLVTHHGGEVAGTLSLRHHCRSCGGAVNQVILGIAGEANAQQCIWSGGATSPKLTRNVALRVPDAPGIYAVRARYAQARNCQDALGWWRVDRPHGPGPEATIAFITVHPRRLVPRPPPRPSASRGFEALLAEARTLTANIDVAAARAARILEGRHRRGDRAELRRLLDDLRADQAQLARTHVSLERAHARALRHRPPIAPPRVRVPAPLSHERMHALSDRVVRAAFPARQLDTVGDALHAGAHVTTAQAVQLVRLFAFDRHKVDAAAMLCPHIVEPSPLPALLDLLTFDTHKRALRDATGGRCGIGAQSSSQSSRMSPSTGR